MKKNYLIAIIITLLALFAFAPPLPAQEGDKGDATKKEEAQNVAAVVSEALKPVHLSLHTSDEIKAKFESIWFKRNVLLAEKKYEETQAIITELVETMLNSGIADLPEFSSALVIEAKELLKEGEAENAVMFCNQAIKLSPKMSKFYFELSNIYFSNLSIVKGISNYFFAMKVQARNFMDSMLYKANLLLYIIVVSVSFIIIFIILIIFKYLNLFLHDLSHTFPQSLNQKIVNLYAVMLLLLPLLLSLGIYWEFVYLFILGFIYTTKNEKKVCYGIAIAMIFLPYLITLTLGIYSFINTDHMKNIYDANLGTWYLETEKNLEKMLNKHPNDPDILLSLGLISKKRGDFIRAEAYYLKGLENAPDSYELTVNLGNVYLAINRPEEAEKYYKTAINIDPTNGTVHYNLNKLYLKLIRLDMADLEFREAMNLSPDAVEYYSEIIKASSPHFNRLVIDEQVTKESYVARYENYVENTKDIASKILPLQVKGIPFEALPFVGVILIFVMAILQLINKSYAFTTVCQKCGGAVCYRCQRSIKDNKLCSQCYYIIVRREGVDPKSKISKMLEIKGYVSRRLFITRFITFLLPGTGHVLKGLTIRGVMFLLLFLILGVNILEPGGFINDIYITGVNEGFFTFGSYVLTFLLAIIYIFVVKDVFQSE